MYLTAAELIVDETTDEAATVATGNSVQADDLRNLWSGGGAFVATGAWLAP